MEAEAETEESLHSSVKHKQMLHRSGDGRNGLFLFLPPPLLPLLILHCEPVMTEVQAEMER